MEGSKGIITAYTSAGKQEKEIGKSDKKQSDVPAKHTSKQVTAHTHREANIHKHGHNVCREWNSHVEKTRNKESTRKPVANSTGPL